MTAGSEIVGVRETLATLTGPLREQMREIEQRINALDVQLHQLRDAKRDIEFVLKRLDPSSTPAVKKRGRQAVSRVEEVRRFIESHNGELADGFGMKKLHQAMRAEIVIGHDMIRAAIKELHDQSVIRIDRRAPGGAAVYKLVGS